VLAQRALLILAARNRTTWTASQIARTRRCMERRVLTACANMPRRPFAKHRSCRNNPPSNAPIQHAGPDLPIGRRRRGVTECRSKREPRRSRKGLHAVGAPMYSGLCRSLSFSLALRNVAWQVGQRREVRPAQLPPQFEAKPAQLSQGARVRNGVTSENYFVALTYFES